MFKEYIFPAIRIIIYILFFWYFIQLPIESIMTGEPCTFEKLFHALSPTCGVTRSFTLLMHGHIGEAFFYSEYFVLFLFPFSVFVMGQDTFTYLRKLITKKVYPSFLEKMVGIK